jgi:hypothetical protein
MQHNAQPANNTHGEKIMENVIYSIIPPKGNVFVVPVLLVIFFAVMAIAAVGILFAINRTNILIKDSAVIIHSFPYGRKIPLEHILADEARAINLNENKEYAVSIRTNGIGLPHFHSGWMRLNNGKKALVFITNKDNVLLMPVKDYVVLFSMDKIEEFISGIKSASRSFNTDTRGADTAGGGTPLDFIF